MPCKTVGKDRNTHLLPYSRRLKAYSMCWLQNRCQGERERERERARERASCKATTRHNLRMTYSRHRYQVQREKEMDECFYAVVTDPQPTSDDMFWAELLCFDLLARCSAANRNGTTLAVANIALIWFSPSGKNKSHFWKKEHWISCWDFLCTLTTLPLSRLR